MVLELLIDRQEKEAAQRNFRAQLEKDLGFRAMENIGYQGGGDTYDVYSRGPGTLYYAYSPPNAQHKTPRHWNSFGIYSDSGVGGIGVEINIPSKQNSGRVAGFFARDPNSGTIYVMHDGGIGGGRPGISKNPFLAWLGEDLDIAIAGNARRAGLRIGELGSENLSAQIWKFVQKVDRFKHEVSSGRLDSTAFRKKVVQATKARQALLDKKEPPLDKRDPIDLGEPQLYANYDRRSVHDLFEPNTKFTPQAGKWGVPGIIRLTERPGDFVLFVTLGKAEGSHVFDESISDVGVVRWQSQPQQRLSDRAVIDLINHDERLNTVHLFLRTSSRRGGSPPPYTYLGPLKYLEHDAEREKPAHIAWELLNWPIPADVSAAMHLTIVSESEFAAPDSEDGITGPSEADALAEEDPPKGGGRMGETTRKFKATKRRYLSSEDSRELGLKGELLVFSREKRRLIASGRKDLADRVVHVSVDEGDGAGHDIASFFGDGRTKYIEVKTTTGPKSAEFLISNNELEFSAIKGDQFELCRVFNFDARLNRASSYSVFGAVKDHFRLTETQFRAGVK